MRMLLIFSITVVLVSCLTGCNSDTLTDKSLRNILEQNSEISSGMDLSTVTIKAMEDLDNAEYNKFVLFYGEITGNQNMYFPIFVNTEEKQSASIYWEAPLSMIMQHVLLNESEETNIAVFNKMAECVKTAGINCFSTEESAIDFVNDITVKNSIIDIKTARKIIADQFINSSGQSSDDFKVFFEKGTAIPKYYAVKSSKQVYRWNSVVPESAYPYWSRTNRDSELLLEGMYGPAYGLETVWKVVDIQNSKELSDSYDSIKDIKEKLDVDDQEYISPDFSNLVENAGGYNHFNMTKTEFIERYNKLAETYMLMSISEKNLLSVSEPIDDANVGIKKLYSYDIGNYSGTTENQLIILNIMTDNEDRIVKVTLEEKPKALSTDTAKDSFYNDSAKILYFTLNNFATDIDFKEEINQIKNTEQFIDHETWEWGIKKSSKNEEPWVIEIRTK